MNKLLVRDTWITIAHVQLRCVHELEPECVVIIEVIEALIVVFSATREVREKDLEGEGTIAETFRVAGKCPLWSGMVWNAYCMFLKPVARRPSHHLSPCAFNAIVMQLTSQAAPFSWWRGHSKVPPKIPNWLFWQNLFAQRALSHILEKD